MVDAALQDFRDTSEWTPAPGASLVGSRAVAGRVFVRVGIVLLRFVTGFQDAATFSNQPGVSVIVTRTGSLACSSISLTPLNTRNLRVVIEGLVASGSNDAVRLTGPGRSVVTVSETGTILSCAYAITLARAEGEVNNAGTIQGGIAA